LGLVITPLTLVDGTSLAEFAESGARALSILVRALVDITIRVNHLSLTVSDSLGYLALINRIRNQ
jgi:hypothetical protein